MNTIELWSVIIGGVVLFLVLVVVYLQVEHRKMLRNLEVDTVLDAIDGVRSQLDTDGRNTQLEHEALHKQMQKANGRLQFLLAKDISAELAAAVERDRALRSSSAPPPSPPESTPRKDPDTGA